MGASQSALRALRRTRPVVAAAPLVFSGPTLQWYCEGPKQLPLQVTPEMPEPLHALPTKEQRVLAPPPEFKERMVSAGSVRNIVLLGLTGAGKSTLANQISCTKAFKSGDSMTSVTQEVQQQEFEYNGEKYRVIDTPGFFDTIMTHEQVAVALDQLAKVAKEGLVAVIVIVKDGRFTEENEAVIKFVEAVLGSTAVEKYSMLVVTHTSKSVSKLQEELASLPEGHLGRTMASKVGCRVLGVDKALWQWPPYKTRTNVMRHVEEILKSNDHTAIDCDVMNWGARIKKQLELEFEMQTAGLRKQMEDNRRKFEENQRLMKEAHDNDKAKFMEEQQHLQIENNSIKELLQKTTDEHSQMLKEIESEKLNVARQLESMNTSQQQLQEQIRRMHEAHEQRLDQMKFDYEMDKQREMRANQLVPLPRQQFYVERHGSDSSEALALATGALAGAALVGGGCNVQ